MAILTKEEYYKKPEESIAEYTARTGFMNAPITGDTLNPPAPLNLPPQPTEPNYGATLGSINTLLNPAPTTEDTNQTDYQKQILELTKSLGGKEQYQAEQDKEFGVTETGNQLRDIQNQVTALNLEAAGIPSAIQEQSVGRGVTKAGVAPIEAGLVRQNTLKSLGLAAQGMIIQGKLANAKDLADRAVAIKFQPEEAKLNYLKTAYEMNKDSLERTDKKRAENLQVQLAERTRILAKQKDDYTAAQGWALAAMKNNQGNQAVQIAANEALKLDPSTPDYLQKVFNLVGQYQSDPVAARKALLEEEQIKASTALTWANIAKIKDLSTVLSIKDAKDLGVPYGTTKEQAIALGKVPGVTAEAGALKTNALESAKALLSKLTSGTGTFAVGKSRIFGTQHIPGTAPRDFEIQFNNLKSLLSLDNVKLLKGQGAVSDAERALLAQASAKLDLAQSEPEFKKAIEDIILGLSGKTDLTSQLNPGEILVKDKKTGQIGAIPAKEFDANLYEKQ